MSVWELYYTERGCRLYFKIHHWRYFFQRNIFFYLSKSNSFLFPFFLCLTCRSNYRRLRWWILWFRGFPYICSISGKQRQRELFLDIEFRVVSPHRHNRCVDQPMRHLVVAIDNGAALDFRFSFVKRRIRVFVRILVPQRLHCQMFLQTLSYVILLRHTEGRSYVGVVSANSCLIMRECRWLNFEIVLAVNWIPRVQRYLFELIIHFLKRFLVCIRL